MIIITPPQSTTHHYYTGTGPGVEHMSLQDMDGAGPLPSAQLQDYTTKVLVQDVPTNYRDCKLIKLYIDSLTSVKCEVKKFQSGKSFLATFEQPISKLL